MRMRLLKRAFLLSGVFLFAATTAVRAQGEILVAPDAQTRYLLFDAVGPVNGDPGGLDWVQPGYDDSTWSAGQHGVGYDAGGMVRTDVSPADLWAVYTRTVFTVPPEGVDELWLGVDYDDGYVAWINGVEVSRAPQMAGLDESRWDVGSGGHESSNTDDGCWNLEDISAIALPLLQPGENVLALGNYNSGNDSSDLIAVPLLMTENPNQDPPAVGLGSVTRYLPNTSDPGLGLTWTAEDFDDSGWAVGTHGVGIDTGTLIQTSVAPNDKFSIWTRSRFTIPSGAVITQVTLFVDYDDGFVAWINGVEVDRAPQMAGRDESRWDVGSGGHESSNGACGGAFILGAVDIALTALPVLHTGENVLAVGAYDGSLTGSSDLVAVPELRVRFRLDQSVFAPNPIFAAVVDDVVPVELGITDACNAGRDVTFTVSSDDPGIAAPADPGTVTFDADASLRLKSFDVEIRGEGETTLRTANGANCGDVTATVTVIPIQSIAIDLPFAAMQIGDTQQASVTGSFGAAGPRDLVGSSTGTTYASNNENVATVDASGVVTAVGLGTAEITATNVVSATVSVVVAEQVSRIAFLVGAPDTAILNEGDRAVVDHLKSLTFSGVPSQFDPAGLPPKVVTISALDFEASRIDADFDLLLISSTVPVGNVAGKFRCLNIPRILWNSGLNQPDFEGMTSDGGIRNPGTGDDDLLDCPQGIFVFDGSHPITQGLTLETCLAVYNEGQTQSVAFSGMQAGSALAGGARVLAELEFVDNATIVVAGPAGDPDIPGGNGLRVDGLASFLSRQVFLWLHDATFDNLNETGEEIFDRAVNWALAGPRTALAFDTLTISGPPRIPLDADVAFIVRGSTAACELDVTTSSSIRYASSDESIATVDPFGVVRGVAEGPVTITATHGAAQVSINLTVNAAIGTAVVTTTVRLGGDNNDVEEFLSDGSLDFGSSDLELGAEGGGGSLQYIALRFVNVKIPQGAPILSAVVQFTVDETDDEDTSLRIYGELSPNAAPYTDTLRVVSNRPRTSRFADWNNIPLWSVVGESGPDQRTPDLREVVQEVVNQPTWTEDSALAFIIAPNPGGERTAESANGDCTGAALLTVTFLGTPVRTVRVQVAAGEDDAEEHLNDNSIDLTSSDLELGEEGSGDFQLVGMRFDGVDVPRGATIRSAELQFMTDENNNTQRTDLRVFGEAAPDAAPFTATARDISNRVPTLSSVDWPDVPVWDTVAEAGPGERNADLSAIIQEIVEQPGWTAGNALVLIVEGSGERTAESYDGDCGAAPVLTVTFDEPAGPPPELVRIMGGLGSAPDRFISPLGETVPLNTVDFDLTADVEFESPQPGFTLISNGGGNHTLTSDQAVPVGTCVTLSFDVRDLDTGAVGTITFTVCHLPLDVNQDGVVNIQDITAWGAEFNGARRASLVDTNGDGNVNVQDATAVGSMWFGRPPATKPWSGEALP